MPLKTCPVHHDTARESQADEKRAIKKAETDAAKRAKLNTGAPPAATPAAEAQNETTTQTKTSQDMLKGDTSEKAKKGKKGKKVRKGKKEFKTAKKEAEKHESKAKKPKKDKKRTKKQEAKEDEESAACEDVAQPRLEDSLPIVEAPKKVKNLKFSINHEGSISQYLFRAPSAWYGGPGSKAFKYQDDESMESAYASCVAHLKARCAEYGVPVPTKFAD